MGFEATQVLKNFYVIGVSHANTPVEIRELFAIEKEKQKDFLTATRSLENNNTIVLSTCNRTELYVTTDDLTTIKELFITYTRGSISLLQEHAYQYNGEEALTHLYKVGAGLDSQILGDFQIIGQLKEAYRQAEEKNTVGTLFNRIFSSVFQASKKIKNTTNLSNGAASVSHAAVQYIKSYVPNIDDAKLLLYGTGEIGKITCDNLISHTKNRYLTLINRNNERAETLAKKYNIEHKPVAKLKEEIGKADVIIVATGAHAPTLKKEHITPSDKIQIFLDLSVPRNISPQITDFENTKLIDIDKLSQTSNEVLDSRKQSIPTAKAIIEESRSEFYEWLEMQHLAPIFKKVKQGLSMIKEQELAYHKNKLSVAEYEKVNLIAGNIINKITKMSILHIKDVFKSEKGTMDIIQKMFSSSEIGMPHSVLKNPKHHHHHSHQKKAN